MKNTICWAKNPHNPIQNALFSAVLFAAAIPALQAAPASKCARADDLFAASQAYGLGDPRLAQQLRQAVELCPTHAAAWNDLGVIAEAAQDWDAALSAYNQAIKSDPNLPAPHAGLGDLYSRQGKTDAAIVAYERFLSLASAAGSDLDPKTRAELSSYQDKLAALKAPARPASAGTLVTAEQIYRSLQPSLTRGKRAIILGDPSPRPNSGPAPKSACDKAGKMDVLIHFAFNSTRIAPVSQHQMKEVQRAITEATKVNNCRVEIVGHADQRGSIDYNQRLSEQRASTVKSWLITAGVSPQHLQTSGRGKFEPLDPSHTEDAYVANRRVEFVNRGPATP